MMGFESIRIDLSRLGRWWLGILFLITFGLCHINFLNLYFIIILIVGLGIYEILFRRLKSIWTGILIVQMTGLLTIIAIPTKEAWFLFITVFANDAMALCGGTYLNFFSWLKKNIFPNISPNKTLGGFLYGLFFGSLLGVISVHFLGLPFYHQWFTPIFCLVGTVGDLGGSKFKREANVKESGEKLFTEKLMCGHGGIIDRFDSLSAVCLFWISWKILQIFL